MKTKKIIIFFLSILNFVPFLCLAEDATTSKYQLMEGIPGFFTSGQAVDFPAYIMGLYKFGLWTIGGCAMIMIMFGGFMYITSAGNTSKTGQAKEVITNALAGLFLALVSFLLLYTINPDLVKFIPLVN